MAHDIFISYSSKDKQTADAICHILESNKLRCWIAPRNIIAGKNYAEQIMYGIKAAKIVVLVFSKNSQESVFVNSEIDTAFSNDKPIISFKIDETFPEHKMEFFLKNKHWLDAYPDPVKVFDTLVRDATLLCKEQEDNEEINPFYAQFDDEDDTSELEKKLNSKEESVIDVVELDKYPQEDSEKEELKESESVEKKVEDSKKGSGIGSKESKQESVKEKVEDSKKGFGIGSKESEQESVKEKVEDSKKGSGVGSKESEQESVKEKVENSKKGSGVGSKESVKKKVENPKKDSNSKVPSKNKPNATKSRPKKDLKSQGSGHSGGGLSQYKIPIIAGVALIVIVIVGIMAFGGESVVETNLANNTSEVGIDVDYVGIAGDGESYYVYGSVPSELMNSSKSIIHVDFYDDSGNIIKSDETKLKDFDGHALDACLVGKKKVDKVVVELRDGDGNVLSSAETDKIK